MGIHADGVLPDRCGCHRFLGHGGAGQRIPDTPEYRTEFVAAVRRQDRGLEGMWFGPRYASRLHQGYRGVATSGAKADVRRTLLLSTCLARLQLLRKEHYPAAVQSVSSDGFVLKLSGRYTGQEPIELEAMIRTEKASTMLLVITPVRDSMKRMRPIENRTERSMQLMFLMIFMG